MDAGCTHVTTVAVEGTNVTFVCATRRPNDAVWEYVPHGSSEEITVYIGDEINPLFINRFRITFLYNEGQLLLTVVGVKLGDAGSYKCIDSDSSITQLMADLIMLGE